MRPFPTRASARRLSRRRPLSGVSMLLPVLLLIGLSNSAVAQQDVRYSWLDMSVISQDFDRAGTLVPIVDQVVDVSGSDGSGIRFRGSVGTWHNLYLFFDYSSSDIDVDAVVTNPGGTFPAADEFDYTSRQGGVGWKTTILNATDIYGEISYDNLDLDFGSFAGEDFDTHEGDIGAEIGVRSMIRDNLELRGHARYTNVGDVDLTSGEFGADTLFGVGFAWELIRGLSIVGDFETGEFSSLSLGFRLDLDED